MVLENRRLTKGDVVRTLHFSLGEKRRRKSTEFTRFGRSDFQLFLGLKKFMLGKNFSSNEKVKTAVEAYFADLLDSHFMEGSTDWMIIGASLLMFM